MDVIIISNISPPQPHPPNVIFRISDLQDFSRRLKAINCLDIKLVHPYLLCDYKPMYGQLYQDYITGYTHWGYGDIDLIYGNLSKFISPLLESGYEVISFRKELLSGSLTIFENEEKTNELYRRGGHYLRALHAEPEKHKGLDETAGDNNTWKNGSLLALPPQCMTYIVASAKEAGYIKAHFETLNRERIFQKEKIIFDKGTIKLGTQELAYYHFVCNKGRPEYIFPEWKVLPEKYFITDTGFYNASEIRRLQSIQQVRRGKAVYKRVKSKIKRSLHRLFN